MASGRAEARAKLVQAAPQPAPTPAPTPPLGRLPDTVKPLAYRLDMTIDPAKERFSGAVEIDAELARATDTVFLHGRDLAMQRAEARIGGMAIPGSWRQADPLGGAVLRFPAPLPAGKVTFAFAYDAPFGNSAAGLFRVKVGPDWYSWSQFESIDARAAFPSFDEPGFKTPFSVTIRSRPGLVAVSNAPEQSKALEGELEVHRFEATAPLPTYLVAMMVGPFSVAEGQAPPTPQRAKPLPVRVIAARPDAAKVAFALENSKQIVTHLEDYFADAFPFPKIDQIATPIMPGAMENAGAALYGDSILLVDERSSVPRKRDFGIIVGHELAHQWFGDLVTPAWWDDIWLNESFANWMGYRIGAAWRPDLGIAAGANAEGFAAMDTDALIAGRPIRQAIERNSQIDSAFDAITYGKGGQVLAMIAGFMGDGKFRDGVRRYLAGRRFGSATSSDFFASLAEAAGDPRIVPALRSFTDQQGVPLLTITSRGDRFFVSQSRYAMLGTAAPPTRWIVPVCLRRAEARSCRLLDGQSETIELKGKGPLIPNADGAGYYRFDMLAGAWDRLIATADRLPVNEAQAVADSLLASFHAGRASASQVAALTRRLARHPDSRAAGLAGDLLGGLTGPELIDSGAAPAYRAFVSRLFRPVLAKAGFDARAGVYAGENPDTSQRRMLAVSQLYVGGRDRVLRRMLAEAAQRYFAGDASALDPAWFDVAFDAWLDAGNTGTARALVETALASDDAEFRTAAIGAAATTGKGEIAQWLLNELIDPRLRSNERRDLLRGVIGTRGTREFGYRWLLDHFDALSTGAEGIFFASRLPSLLESFCSIERSREFAREFRPRLAGKPGEVELERAIERVRNCGVLRTALADVVSSEIRDLH